MNHSTHRQLVASAALGFMLGVTAAGCTTTTDLSPRLKETAEVGPSGGRVRLAGAEVEVPPNAVQDKTTITISIENAKPSGYTVDGAVYRFEPEGLVFSVPLTVSFPTSTPNPVVFWTVLGSTERFEPLATTTENGKTTAHPNHFSRGFAGGQHLKPKHPCEAPAHEACDRCGTRTGSSDEQNGLCRPNSTKACGRGGSQTCNTNCEWDPCSDRATLFAGRIAGVYDHACAVRMDGAILCWGSNAYGETTPPSGAFSQVTAGRDFSCGLRTDGTLTCWGRSDYTNAPPGTYKQVDSGMLGSCAIRSDDSIACWGPPEMESYLTPPAGFFRRVSVGSTHACGLKPNGTTACWSTLIYKNGWAPPVTEILQDVHVGEKYTCGLKPDGTIECWGDINHPDAPTKTPSGTFRRLDTGSFHACAIRTSDDVATCWGFTSTDGRGEPGATAYREVAVSLRFGCGIRIDGALSCWGPDAPTPPGGTF